MDILAITKPFSLKLLRKVLSKMLRRKRKAFSEKKNMTGSISDKEQREIGREMHRENSFLKVPTPVFVIIFDWVESGYKNLLVLDQDIAGLTLLVIGGGRENKMQNAKCKYIRTTQSQVKFKLKDTSN